MLHQATRLNASGPLPELVQNGDRRSTSWYRSPLPKWTEPYAKIVHVPLAEGESLSTRIAEESHLEAVVQQLTQPARVWRRSECLARPSALPREPGLYAWYFRELPPGVEGRACVQFEGLTLLYVGTAPNSPTGHSGQPSTSSLRVRIRQHYAGNAEGSTLRFTLGVLLASQLGLTPTPERKSKSFGDGEASLNTWMEGNAFVIWMAHPAPWSIEPEVIAGLDLPLNLTHNRAHPFWPTLTSARSRWRRPPA